MTEERLFSIVPDRPSDYVVRGARAMLASGYGLVLGPLQHLGKEGGIDTFRVKSRNGDEWYDTQIDSQGRVFCSCQGFRHGYCAHIHVCRCVLDTALRSSTFSAA